MAGSVITQGQSPSLFDNIWGAVSKPFKQFNVMASASNDPQGTYNKFVNTTFPQSQPIDYSTAGYNYNVPRPTTTSGGNSGNNAGNPPPPANTDGGGGEPDYNAQLDAIYNPVNDFLNQLASEYQSQQPQAEQQISNSFDRALTPINEQEQTQLTSQNKQEGLVNREESNALAQARRIFNELSQRNLATYGTGSTAGPAASEILGRQTAQQFGQIGETATQGRTNIEEERGNIKKFAAQKRTDLEQQKQDAIRQVQAEFRQGMLQINQTRAQNESAKAAARLELLQQAQQRAYEIEQANTAYQRAIDVFEREKGATLASNATYQSSQTLGPDAAARIAQIVNSPGSNAEKTVQILSTGIDPKIAGTIIGQLEKKDDLSNPFGG